MWGLLLSLFLIYAASLIWHPLAEFVVLALVGVWLAGRMRRRRPRLRVIIRVRR